MSFVPVLSLTNPEGITSILTCNRRDSSAMLNELLHYDACSMYGGLGTSYISYESENGFCHGLPIITWLSLIE